MKLNRLLSLACVTVAVTFAGFSGAASAQTPDVLNVATDATFPPMEYTENGARTGFDIDLMNALAKAMGKRVQWTDIDFKGLIPGLIAHRFDAAISGIYITDDRAKVVDFYRLVLRRRPRRAGEERFAGQVGHRSERQESVGPGGHEVGQLPARQFPANQPRGSGEESGNVRSGRHRPC